MVAVGKRSLTVEEVELLLDDMASKIQGLELTARYPKQETRLRVYGVPRGGIPVALGLAHRLGAVITSSPSDADVIVDDIYDSGKTAERFTASYRNTPFVCLVDKRDEGWNGQWIVMPWEVTQRRVMSMQDIDEEFSPYDGSADDIVTRLLEFLGEDPDREGLRDTPRRVLEAWKEWGQGYGEDPAAVLKTFVDGSEDCGDELVIVHNIPVVSKCEHHLADIIGIAHVGYIPNGKIVGLSKLARVTDLFARRLQVQERLTNQIADAIWKTLDPKGVGVIVRASHACMSTRGVKVHGSVTTTSAMRGVLLSKPEARAEFLTLCAAADK